MMHRQERGKRKLVPISKAPRKWVIIFILAAIAAGFILAVVLGINFG